MPNSHIERNALQEILSDRKLLDTLSKETLRDGMLIALREGGEQGTAKILRLIADELTAKTMGVENLLGRASFASNIERLDRFGIVISPRRVEFVTDGSAPLEFLKTLDDIHRGKWGRGIVSPEAFEVWRSDAGFTAPSPAGISIRVEVNVPGSTSMSRASQVARGWNDVPLHELAMASAVHSVATGSSFLEGLVVRASNGALIQYHDGLHPRTYFGEAADCRVSASRRFSLSDPR